MKAVLVLLVAFLVCLGAAPVSWAQDMDPVGRYSFTLTDMKVAGDCPMGQDNSGRLSIIKEGPGYVLTYIEGMECRPPSVCTLGGRCKGPECAFSTTVQVDDEGGKVTNSVTLRFNGGNASGPGKSVYKHPSGFTCAWTYLVTLTR